MVTAASAGFEGGNYAKITVDGEVIDCGKNENGHDRGVHIVVINPLTGKVRNAKVFDTYKSSEEWNNFILTVPQGYVVAVACKDECSKSWNWGGKKFLVHMGAIEIWYLQYRQGYVFIGEFGRAAPWGCANEKRAEKVEEAVSTTQVFTLRTES